MRIEGSDKLQLKTFSTRLAMLAVLSLAGCGSDKAEEAREKAREAQEKAASQARELVDRSKELSAQAVDKGSEALDHGKQLGQSLLLKGKALGQ